MVISFPRSKVDWLRLIVLLRRQNDSLSGVVHEQEFPRARAGSPYLDFITAFVSRCHRFWDQQPGMT